MISFEFLEIENISLKGNGAATQVFVVLVFELSSHLRWLAS